MAGTIALVIVCLAIWLAKKSLVVVPPRTAYVVERLGRYAATLEKPGLHFILPLLDVVRFKHTVAEQTIEVAETPLVSRDNVELRAAGVLHVKVVDPEKASYAIANFRHALDQLARITLMSEIGKRTAAESLGEREALAASVAAETGKAAAAWGVDVLRFDLGTIAAPPGVVQALEEDAAKARVARAIQALTTEPLPERTGAELVAAANEVLASRPEDPAALATLAAGLARSGDFSGAAGAQRRAIEALRGMLTHRKFDERRAILEKAEELRERYASRRA